MLMRSVSTKLDRFTNARGFRTVRPVMLEANSLTLLARWPFSVAITSEGPSVNVHSTDQGQRRMHTGMLQRADDLGPNHDTFRLGTDLLKVLWRGDPESHRKRKTCVFLDALQELRQFRADGITRTSNTEGADDIDETVGDLRQVLNTSIGC